MSHWFKYVDTWLYTLSLSPTPPPHFSTQYRTKIYNQHNVASRLNILQNTSSICFNEPIAVPLFKILDLPLCPTLSGHHPPLTFLAPLRPKITAHVHVQVPGKLLQMSCIETPGWSICFNKKFNFSAIKFCEKKLLNKKKIIFHKTVMTTKK